MQSIINKVLNRIYGRGKGWAFFKNDFADIGSTYAIEKSLIRLTNNGNIRRVLRGLYDYPKYSELLEKELSPDIDQVAHALARKFGWKIQISGNTALNVIGLSTQIPTNYLYYSNGKNKTYKIGNVELEFKKATLKDIGMKYPESALLVRALKALGKKQLAKKQKDKIRNYFSKEKQKRILKDTQYTTSWVYETIKSIFSDEK